MRSAFHEAAEKVEALSENGKKLKNLLKDFASGYSEGNRFMPRILLFWTYCLQKYLPSMKVEAKRIKESIYKKSEKIESDGLMIAIRNITTCLIKIKI